MKGLIKIKAAVQCSSGCRTEGRMDFEAYLIGCGAGWLTFLVFRVFVLILSNWKERKCKRQAKDFFEKLNSLK